MPDLFLFKNEQVFLVEVLNIIFPLFLTYFFVFLLITLFELNNILIN
jgi:hypothetical protein